MTLTICDHAGAVGAALNTLASHRAQPMRDPRARPRLSLVPLLCGCGRVECRKPVLLQELEQIKRAHIPGVNTDQLMLAQDAALIAIRDCPDKPSVVAQRQVLPLEDIEQDHAGSIIESWHEQWKEFGR